MSLKRKPDKRYPKLWICLLIAAATLAVYWQTTGFGFVDYDDDIYITNNPHVTSGLSLENLHWATTAVYHATWQPLVWVSLMLDYEIGNGQPWAYHLTNVLLHTANAVLLFLLLDALTLATWRSAVVAALFALHPLRVESVAWVAERKDVLSGLFWLLTTWAYVVWTRRPSLVKYLLVVIAYVCGLAAKPALIAVPFVLLLLDFWPLGRIKKMAAEIGARQTWTRLVSEKVPLLVLAAGSMFVTMLAHKSQGAVAAADFAPLGQRIACSVVNYVSYLGKTLWPRDLACLYPNPGNSLPVWAVVVSSVLLIAVSALAVIVRARRPYLLAGWFWYLVALAPASGLVQIGMHGIADRFTYIPHIGLFVAIVWALADLTGQRWRPVLGAVAMAAILALGVRSYDQAGHWRDSRKLFSHALQISGEHAFLCSKLATVLEKEGDIEAAVALYEDAARLAPQNALVRAKLGTALAAARRLDEALAHFEEATRLEPENSIYRSNYGQCLFLLGHIDRAEREFVEALRLDPNNSTARANYARLKEFRAE